jgi:tRNA(adenine34) deaminase
MQLSQNRLEELMSTALALAQRAKDTDNSPFGAVVATQDGEIIVKAMNTTNTDTNPIAHAEINALLELAQRTHQKKFKNYILVSNVQSCPMCFSACYRSGFRHFVYGCAEDSTLVPKISVHELNSLCKEKAEIISGILKDECQKQLAKARETS